MQNFKLINKKLFDELKDKAFHSARKRINYNFHESDDALVHRFLNVLLQDTYVTPHRHFNDPKFETFLVLEGALLLYFFTEDGKITDIELLAASDVKFAKELFKQRNTDRQIRVSSGIDIDIGVWHTLLPLTQSAVCFEIKPGPYRKSSDKDFAPWAPREGVDSNQEISSYQKFLKSEAINLFGLSENIFQD